MPRTPALEAPLGLTYTYRDIMNDVCLLRQRRNPKYSLRAYARDLGLLPSRLSQVMKGQRGLSERASHLLVKKLQLTNSLEKELFIETVVYLHSRNAPRNKVAREILQKISPSKSYRFVDLDIYDLIADWHHLAILGLLEGRTGKTTVDFLAKKLSLPTSKVESALKILKRFKFVDVDRSGKKWIATIKDAEVSSTVPSEAIQRNHRQTLELASKALTRQHPDQRHFANLTFAIDKKFLPEFKIEIDKFLRKVDRMGSVAKKRDEVYNLGIYFFSLEGMGAIQ